MNIYQPFSVVAFVALYLSAFGEVRGDTVLFAGAEISLPDEGWGLRESGRVTYLINKDKKLVIELYRFSKVPPADKDHILKVMKPHKNTTDINVHEAKKRTQHGLSATATEGTAKIEAKPVYFRLVGIPVQDHAVIAVAFVPGEKKNHQTEIEGILKSLKARQRPSAPPRTQPDSIVTAPDIDPDSELSPPLVQGPSTTVVVPGTSNLWRAAQIASATTPPEVKGIPITPGTRISISATGGVTNNVENGTPKNGPDGNRSWFPRHNAGRPDDGIASLYAPGNSVIGVFLGGDSRNSNPAPQHLDFQPGRNRFNGVNYITLSPALKQPFYFGNGRTDGGKLQHVIVPVGATRLFLGAMDSNAYGDNAGQFKVTVNVSTVKSTSPPSPSVEPEQAQPSSASPLVPRQEHTSRQRFCRRQFRRRGRLRHLLKAGKLFIGRR